MLIFQWFGLAVIPTEGKKLKALGTLVQVEPIQTVFTDNSNATQLRSVRQDRHCGAARSIKQGCGAMRGSMHDMPHVLSRLSHKSLPAVTASNACQPTARWQRRRMACA